MWVEWRVWVELWDEEVMKDQQVVGCGGGHNERVRGWGQEGRVLESCQLPTTHCPPSALAVLL